MNAPGVLQRDEGAVQVRCGGRGQRARRPAAELGSRHYHRSGIYMLS